jgi:protein-disulfide isomerase
MRGFPLDPSCNRSVQHSGHPVACEAARAAICAAKAGKFEKVYEELFEKQSAIAPGLPAAIAKDTGISESEFAQCMASSETAARVVADIDEGLQLGVKSTPTFFINGHKIEGAYPVVAWQRIVEALLQQQKK